MITYAGQQGQTDIIDAALAGAVGAWEGAMHESEITYRMARLRGEADRARLAAGGRSTGAGERRSGIRRLVGRALIGLGELLEEPTPSADERTGTLRA